MACSMKILTTCLSVLTSKLDERLEMIIPRILFTKLYVELSHTVRFISRDREKTATHSAGAQIAHTYQPPVRRSHPLSYKFITVLVCVSCQSLEAERNRYEKCAP